MLGLLLIEGCLEGEMDDNLVKVGNYRDRAANLRALAAQDENTQTREASLSIARKYDRLSTKFLTNSIPKRPQGGTGNS